MTIEEKAQMIHDRETARQQRNSYQEQVGKLSRELWGYRTASFCFGVSFGCIVSALIVYL